MKLKIILDFLFLRNLKIGPFPFALSIARSAMYRRVNKNYGSWFDTFYFARLRRTLTTNGLSNKVILGFGKNLLSIFCLTSLTSIYSMSQAPNEILHQGIFNSNIDLVMQAIEQGADLNNKDILGNTPLTAAIPKCNKAIIKLLLKNGADPNGKSPILPLIVAINWNHTNIVKLLLKFGADPNNRDSWNWTALIHAANKYRIFQNNLSIIKLLLDNGANLDNAIDFTKRINFDGITKILKALQTVQPDDICPVCRIKAKKIPKEKVLTTPCCKKFICKNDLKSLEKRAAELWNILHDSKLRAQYGASEDFTGWPDVQGPHAICPLCRSYPLYETPNEILLKGINNKDINLIKNALKNKADTNVQNQDGFTALMILLDTEEPEDFKKINIVKLLLEAGANVNLKNKEGTTALDFAKKNNFKEIIKLIEAEYEIRKKIIKEIKPKKRNRATLDT